MKLQIVFALLMTLPPLGVGAQNKVIEPTEVTTQVMDLLDKAWDAGDADAFAAPFTVDTDVINVFGTHIRGRSDLAKQMKTILGRTMKGSTHRSRVVEAARYLNEDTIIAISSGVIDIPTRPLAPQANNRQTFLLVRLNGVWQIRHWHNTPITAEPKSPDRPAEQGAAADAVKPRG